MDVTPEITPYPANPTYGVTRCGRVFRIKDSCRTRAPFELRTHGSPYPKATLSGPDKKQRAVRVHRMVAETFLPNPTALPEVAHKDGNPKNNAEDNLRWSTHPDNERDKIQHGTLLRGEHSGPAKLTEAEVRTILAARGARGVDLARQYGVAESTICMIRTRRNWKHV